MEVRNSTIEGLFEIFPTVLRDSRGWFLESYNKDKFQELDLDFNFVQDNLSFSKAGVLRGIHFQTAPHEQGKLVKVVQGEVLDVAVDLRPESPTFGSYEKVVLTAEKQNMFFIPEGFGHAFYAITDAFLFYKCTKTYQAKFDSGIAYDDPDLAIDWNTDKPIISEKDKNLQSFQVYKSELGLV
jgi:dTDP-4-dehydrorhamnose 3,5-epimerase